MDWRLDKKAYKVFDGFPPEDENEDLGAYLRMSSDERIELVGRLQRQYFHSILNLPEIPPLKRVAKMTSLEG